MLPFGPVKEQFIVITLLPFMRYSLSGSESDPVKPLLVLPFYLFREVEPRVKPGSSFKVGFYIRLI